MKTIVIVSGKGGTGKSTLAASLAQIVPRKMIADCDVEAANLHLILEHRDRHREDFSGAKTARIDLKLCTACGLCRQVCRFDAITPKYEVLPLACEGCAACTVLCPTDAISMHKVKTGETVLADSPYGLFSYGTLDVGAEGSGLLVTQVRKNLYQEMQDEEFTIIDGSPGTGCVVIASITGADAVLAVAEPTQSGLEDLKRVLAVAAHFRVPGYVCINKWDLNRQMTDRIAGWCEEQNYPLIGLLPFEPRVVEALRRGQTPIEAQIETVARPIREIWQRIKNDLTLEPPAERG